MADAGLMVSIGSVRIRHREAGRLIVLFPYSRDRVEKIRMVAGHRWHHKEKYWTVLCTDGSVSGFRACRSA